MENHHVNSGQLLLLSCEGVYQQLNHLHHMFVLPSAESTICSGPAPCPPAGSLVHRMWGCWLDELVWRVKTQGRTALPASVCCTAGWMILRMFTMEEASPKEEQKEDRT